MKEDGGKKRGGIESEVLRDNDRQGLRENGTTSRRTRCLQLAALERG